MAYLFLFLSSVAVALSGAMMPGPLLTATVTESSRRGASAGPLFILGHGILEGLLVAAIAAGFAEVLRRPGVFVAISLVGSLVMLHLAIGMFRSLPTLELDLGAEGEGYGHLVLEGIVLSVSNPYWTLWWVTIGLGYILRGMELGIPGVLAFFLGHVFGDLVWYAAVSYAVSRGRRFLKPVPYRILIGFCAGILFGFGVYFFYSGIRGFFGG